MATVYVENTVTTEGANKDFKEIRVMMKQLTASVTSQAAILVALSVRTNSSGNRKWQNTEGKKIGLACTCAHTIRGKYILRRENA